MIIGEYSPRQSRGEYSSIITEPENKETWENLMKSIGNHSLLWLEFNVCLRHFLVTLTEQKTI